MIIKYIHNGKLTCTYYENECRFLKECYNPEFKDIILNAKDVIVLDNTGYSYRYKTMLEVYNQYKNFVIK